MKPKFRPVTADAAGGWRFEETARAAVILIGLPRQT
jgi:hypothetical protein